MRDRVSVVVPMTRLTPDNIFDVSFGNKQVCGADVVSISLMFESGKTATYVWDGEYYKRTLSDGTRVSLTVDNDNNIYFKFMHSE